MAKSQKRSNREIRKPKKAAKAAEPAPTSSSFLNKGVSAFAGGSKKK
ncbi:hypothetical protein [Roseibium marinum]|uniref:Uncharacterized protein n=1 Tax=Roseibium marinum TaxID=281252 RepID=A0A2S3UXC5_9HYPH|nr:hypothetical protein [Roseibium marinum]POF32119.1 hypothetical protein CLV41_10338 [Roseibium marinum]